MPICPFAVLKTAKRIVVQTLQQLRPLHLMDNVSLQIPQKTRPEQSGVEEKQSDLSAF